MTSGMFGTESIYAARYAGLGLGLKLAPTAWRCGLEECRQLRWLGGPYQQFSVRPCGVASANLNDETAPLLVKCKSLSPANVLSFCG
jgi:hypothetical protein